jgi:hypothetical protein
MMEVRPDFGPLVDRYWPKADIYVYVAFDVGSKADMGWCTAHVCF